ncbi:MAG TPA: chemotaxis protein CheB [Jatrophihabitans sp.]|jgi:two-component system chemotaxis response regulator CheB
MTAVVGIGGSAGSIALLLQILPELPADLPAAVVVTVHQGDRPSLLPTLFSRAGPLPARHASDGDGLTEGQILVAPPGRHLLVHRNHVRLSNGPRVNRSRPAVDVMFASIATTIGSRAAGVVLSGMLDDGAAGSALIAAAGGRMLVQDPQSTRFPSMPAAALAAAPDAWIAGDADLAGGISELAEYCARQQQEVTMAADEGPMMTESGDVAFLRPQETRLTRMACPDCGGVLAEVSMPTVSWFQCHVGHQFGPASLAAAQADAVEFKAWAALAALEEQVVGLEHLADLAEDRPEAITSNAVTQRARAETPPHDPLADDGDEIDEAAGTQAIALRDPAALRARAEAAKSFAEQLRARLTQP